MTADIKNLPASIHGRLRNKARERRRPFQEILQYYANERFLYRLAQSKHANTFVLKGALIFFAWGIPLERPTRDIDLRGFTLNSLDNLTEIIQEICSEPYVANVFNELIRDSYIAETDGHTALVMIVEGESDSDVAESVQGKIIPSLQKNHGEDSILELRTIRILDPIRSEHNYLPLVNMENGFLKKDWPDEVIFAE